MASRAASGPGFRPLRALAEALLRLPRAGAWTLVLGWCALITWMSSQPGSVEPRHWIWPVLSNSAHSVEFGLLAAWLSLLLPRVGGWPDLRVRKRLLLAATVLGLALADELHQGLTPDRDLSVFDVLTDLVGSFATLSIVAYLGRADGTRAGIAARLALAALAGLAAGALATVVPRCFPGIAWF